MCIYRSTNSTSQKILKDESDFRATTKRPTKSLLPPKRSLLTSVFGALRYDYGLHQSLLGGGGGGKTHKRRMELGVEDAPNDPKMNLNVKSALQTLNTYPWTPHFGPFRFTFESRYRTFYNSPLTIMLNGKK